jgi:hypothetical protein
MSPSPIVIGSATSNPTFNAEPPPGASFKCCSVLINHSGVKASLAAEWLVQALGRILNALDNVFFGLSYHLSYHVQNPFFITIGHGLTY